MLDFDSLAAQTRREGGFTTALDGTQPTAGYAVGIGYEHRPTSGALADAIYSYVVHYGRALRDPGAHLGAWTDPDGDVFLDVTQVFRDRNNALTFARANGERAIYDLANQQEISVYA